MKNKTGITILALLISIAIIAQVPQALNYQAVARNASGTVLQNQHVGIRLSVHDGSSFATVVYQETDTATTNQFGLFTTLIGNGIVTVGTFSGIAWNTGNKYLEVELDPSGGSNYSNMGTTQMVSVPYALYSLSSGSGFTHYIGESFGGGVIFQVYKDTGGNEHGLVVALNDQSNGTAWSNIDSTLIGSAAESSWNGVANTNAIIAQAGQTNSAAQICKNYNGGGYSDWYLPSVDEINLLFINRYYINKTLSTTGTEISYSDLYWSSTEGTLSEGGAIYAYAFYNGTAYASFEGGSPKNHSNSVRAIRAF